MSDPLAGDPSLTGIVQNGAFTPDRDEPGSGQGDDAEVEDARREGEPDTGPERIEPGQD